MTTLRDAAQQALGALETALSDAYHRRFPECCGRPGIECCGNPNEAWTPEDNKIMDLLSPAQRQLSEALRASLAEQPAQPVAWRWLYNGSPDSEKCFPMPGPDADDIAKAGASEFPRTVQYLYTAPQPRRRLTDEDLDNTTRKQVDDLLDHIYEYGTAAEGINYRVRAIARAIERAHGIGEHE